MAAGCPAYKSSVTAADRSSKFRGTKYLNVTTGRAGRENRVSRCGEDPAVMQG